MSAVDPVALIMQAQLHGLFQKHPTESDVVVVMQRPPWEANTGEWVPRWLHDGDIYQVKIMLESHGLAPRKKIIRDKIHAMAESC